MNYAMIAYIIGRLLMMESLCMLPSVVVGYIYGEGSQTIGAFFVTMALLLAVGWMVSNQRPRSTEFYALEGFVVVSLGWVFLSVFGALPFYLSGAVPSYVDALFESTSGFTTTGASVLGNVLNLPRSLLFWRSFTLMLGGMGMLVFVMAVLPKMGSKGVYIMKAELPGPTFGKLESKTSTSIRILYTIYLSMTVVLILLLAIGGIPLFDSFLLGFGVAGTGGFGLHENSIQFYDSYYVEFVLGLFMMLFGVNFNLYYLIFIRRMKDALKNEELKWYLGFIGVSVLLLCINLRHLYDNVVSMVFEVFFTVTSVISTTAYTNTDLGTWPVASHVILLFLMFSGAMAGSTTSGLKVSRMAIYIKTTLQEFRRAISPNRAVPITYEGKMLDAKTQRSVSFYLITYAVVFAVLLLFISIDTTTFSSAFSAVIATLNNVGQGLDLLGPSADYAEFTSRSKLLMCLAMVMGRLEIYPVIVLFSPQTWRRG